MTENDIRTQADELVESWLNGNRNAVMEYLLEAEIPESIALAALVGEGLRASGLPLTGYGHMQNFHERLIGQAVTGYTNPR